MKPYHKIQTVFKRDPETNYKTLLMYQYSLPEFEYLKSNTWIFTEKVDGTNIRVMSLPSGDVEFHGKSDNAQLPAKLVQRLTELFPPNGELCNQFPDGACLYGEGYGAKIQKGGGNYSATQEFVLFDIRVGDWWLKRDVVCNIADILKIRVVPVIEVGTLSDMVLIVKGGFKSLWSNLAGKGNFEAEGIVARPKVELFTRNGGRIITKLKCKDFKNV